MPALWSVNLRSKIGAIAKLPYPNSMANTNPKPDPIYNPNCISNLNSNPDPKLTLTITLDSYIKLPSGERLR